jgi:hypothetical protein
VHLKSSLIRGVTFGGMVWPYKRCGLIRGVTFDGMVWPYKRGDIWWDGVAL